MGLFGELQARTFRRSVDSPMPTRGTARAPKRSPSLRKVINSPPIQKLTRLASFKRTTKAQDDCRDGSLNRSPSDKASKARVNPIVNFSAEASRPQEDLNPLHHVPPTYEEALSPRMGSITIQQWNQNDSDIDVDAWARYCM
ncbi:hypothetical protein CROQUDRAFT_722897 [Cronartium quercuum f. sp. fusiforme G11]|uniref:Uncharacterized protein n=1 Tax=Cronartium quercuum f. sp. fusiforme G11 TaxID=708437 RepID=A0A9P6TC72_9BASI|nr:hypothetical protein CROQUDRAFT_722897 [Cronartium quercuum f. sp. fusiforme G11]